MTGRVPTEPGKQGKQGKWLIIIPCRENSGNLKNLQNSRKTQGISIWYFFLICWSSFSWTMICNACMCSGKFNVLSVFLPTFSRADINNIFTVIMRVSHHGTLQPGHVGWVKVSRLTVSISGKNSGNFEMDSLWVPWVREWLDLIFLMVSYVGRAWLKITHDIIKGLILCLRSLLPHTSGWERCSQSFTEMRSIEVYDAMIIARGLMCEATMTKNTGLNSIISWVVSFCYVIFWECNLGNHNQIKWLNNRRSCNFMNIHIILVNQSLLSHHDQGMVGFDISYGFICRAGVVENHPWYN